MVSTSGAQLLPHEAIAQLSQHLLPHTTILTPNIPEATLLLTQNGHAVGEIQSVSDVEAMGRKIQQLGPKWVLVKGGHMPFRKDLTVAKTDDEKETVVDVLVGPEGSVLRVQSPYQKSTSTHGTGCSLACKNISIAAIKLNRSVILTVLQPPLQPVSLKVPTCRPLSVAPVDTSRQASRRRLSLAVGMGHSITSIQHILFLSPRK